MESQSRLEFQSRWYQQPHAKHACLFARLVIHCWRFPCRRCPYPPHYKLHQKGAPKSASRVADSVSDGDGCVPGSEWPCRLRAASVASHQCPGRPLALRCSRGLPTDKMRIGALMKSLSSHRLELPITTRFLTIRSHKRCPTMAPRHVRQRRCSSGMQAKMQARVSLPYEE